MATAKVSVSLDAQVLEEARERVGGRGLSAYVNEAVRSHLQHDRIGELLAQMDAESGPVPTAVLEEARRTWQHSARDD